MVGAWSTGERGGTRWARRAASQASALAGSDERGQYATGDQTSMAGFDTLPMVWSRQRPGARSITDTLNAIRLRYRRDSRFRRHCAGRPESRRPVGHHDAGSVRA